MMRFVESLWLLLFLAGLLLLGLFGTWAETPPFWYGASLLALAGLGALLSRQNRPAESIGWLPLGSMLLLCLYLGWRGLTSEVQWLARQDLVFLATAFLAYGLIAFRFTSPRARLALLALLFLLIAGNTGLGLYQYFENPRTSIFQPFGLKRGSEISAGGFFESGNHLAGFMTLAGLPLLGVALLSRNLTSPLRAAAALGFLLAGTSVAFSTSRGGALGFFAAVGLLLFIAAALHFRRRHLGPAQPTARPLLALGLLAAALLSLTLLTVRKAFSQNANLSSLNGRQALWDAALEQWQTSPLIGTGARSYEYMERGFRTLETHWMTSAGEVDAQFAHNDYLQGLADYGLIGLSLALLAAALHASRSLAALWRSSRASSSHHSLPIGLAAGSLAALGGAMLQALVEFNLHIGINAVMTALVLGLLATPGFPSNPPPTPPPSNPPQPLPKPRVGAHICGPRLALSALLAAISLLLLEAAWRLAPADLAWRQGRKQATLAADLPELIATSGTLQRATSLDPLNPQAWYLRGLVALQIASQTNSKYAQPFYQTALAQLQQSLALYPQNPYASAQAGSVAGYLGLLPDADQHFRNALRWGLNIQSVNELYGDHLLRRQDYYQAIGFLISALHLSNDPDARSNLDRKVKLCLRKLKQQGLTAPPEAFTQPAPPAPN